MLQTKRILLVQAYACVMLLAIPLGVLVLHISQSGTILGRYSRGYFLFLVIYTLVLLAFSLVIWRLSRLDNRKVTHINEAFNSLRRLKALYIFVLIGPWLVFILKMDLFEKVAIGRSSLVQISLLGLLLLWDCVFLTVGQSQPNVRESLGKMLLLIFSLGITLTTFEIILRSNPAMIPNAARPHLAGGGLFLREDLIFDDQPIGVGFRYRPNLDYWINFNESNSDLYRVLPYQSQKLDSTQDVVLSRIHFITDENGYQNPSPLLDQYDIVTTGDSFSATGAVAIPWPRRLEELSGTTVLNLSIPMYGPQSEVEAVKRFGLNRRPKLVILGYFEGNDLSEALGYYEIQESGYGWLEYGLKNGGLLSTFVTLQSFRYGVPDTFGRLYAGPRSQSRESSRVSNNRHFTFNAGSKEIPLTFHPHYISMLTSSREDILASVNYKLASQALLDLKYETEDAEAQLVIVFIPSKEHIYLPLINDDRYLNSLLADIPAMVLGGGGSLSGNEGTKATPQLILDHNNDQREVILEFAKANQIIFLDLTDAFQSKAKEGADIYYEMDTHWNQNGQDLAAETIFDYLYLNIEDAMFEMFTGNQ